MKPFLMAVSLTLSAVVSAQEAKIMILDRADSQALKTAYYDYQAAQKKWESAKAEISRRYTHVDGKIQEGWEKVQFSVDFRAMVAHGHYLRLGGSGTSNNNFLTPAVMSSTSSLPASSSLTINGTDVQPGSITAGSGNLTISTRDGALVIEGGPPAEDLRVDLAVKDSPKAK